MSTYDSYLLRGSDDAPPYPETPTETRRRLRTSPYEFDVEGDVDCRGVPAAYMINAPGRTLPAPNNARARRIRLRIFRRLTRETRLSQQAAFAYHRKTTCWPTCMCERCWPDPNDDDPFLA